MPTDLNNPQIIQPTQPQAGKKLFRHYIYDLVIFFIVLLVFLGCLELVFRVLHLQSDNFIMQDPVIGWVHQPNVSGYFVGPAAPGAGPEFKFKRRTNNDGFLGPDYSVEKPAGTFRVAVLGDSVTEGFQVGESETYSYLLEKEFNKNNQKMVEVMNFGTAGYGTFSEYYILKTKVLKYKPDLVILGFFIGNDINDNSGGPVNEDASFSPKKRIKNTIGLFLRNHLATYRFMREKMFRSSFWSAIKGEKVKHEINLEGEPDPDSLYADKYSETVTRGFNNTQDIIKKINQLAKDNNSVLVVAILPESIQSSQFSNYDKPNNVLKDFLKKEKINYIDVLPDFIEWYRLNPGRVAYWPLDGHPNQNGHKIISESIYSEFMRLNYGQVINF